MPEETLHAGPVVPVVPKRTIWLDVPGYGELGFRALYWANPPQRVLNDLRAKGDLVRQTAALMKLVLEHNGWCDPEGEPYPPAADPAFWDEIDNDLCTQTIKGIYEAAASDPNLERPKRPLSASTSEPPTSEDSPSPGPTSAG